MKTNTVDIFGIVLNIYYDNENENDAWLKVLTKTKILNIKIKGFWNSINKNNNLIIGSFCELEVFENYGSDNKKLLKKVKGVKHLKTELLSNITFIERLCWILQLIKYSNEKLFDEYLSFLDNENNQNINMWFLTYFMNQILVLQHGINTMNYCIKCNLNKEIYAINFLEGIICFNDYQNKLIHKQDWIIEKDIVKGFYFLNISLNDYIKQTNVLINKKIYSILENLYKFLN